MEEQKYPLLEFINDISNIIKKRYSNEGIDFKDYTQDQLAQRLEYDLSKIPYILRENNYPDNKNKLLDVATDIYYLTSQIVWGEKHD